MSGREKVQPDDAVLCLRLGADEINVNGRGVGRDGDYSTYFRDGLHGAIKRAVRCGEYARRSDTGARDQSGIVYALS